MDAERRAEEGTRAKIVLFYRDFRRFTGGNLKIWDYFNHVAHSRHHEPRIWFSKDSVWDESNPWWGDPRFVVTSEDPPSADILFLGGKDWPSLPEAQRDHSPRPILNYVQGVRHAWRRTPESAFLRHRAIRICVSEEVADALRATRRVEGPLFVIPNALDVAALPAPKPLSQRDLDLLIVANKQPTLGRLLHWRLSQPGKRVLLLANAVARARFLELVNRAKVTVFVPNRAEGFYLPALEGMALRTLVVCPDCVGNRSFCLPDDNCLRPAYRIGAIVAAVRAAWQLTPREIDAVSARAAQTALQHDPLAERRAFLDILENVDRLW